MKKIIALVAVAALTVGTLSTAEARIGSATGGSSHTSSTTTTRTAAVSTRVGGSMGVSRPVAMAAATAQSQGVRQYGNISANSTAAKTVTSSVTTTTSATTRTSGYVAGRPGYYNGAPAVYGQPGYTGAHLAMAAIGGAVVGSALSNHGGTTIINNNGGGAPVYGNGGGVYGNGGGVYSNGTVAVPVAVAPATYYHHQSGFVTFLEVVFVILLIGGLIAILVRVFDNRTADAIYSEPVEEFSRTTTTRTETRSTTSVDPEEERAINKGKQLLSSAGQFYRSLQDANNRGDKARLQAMVTKDIFPAIEQDIDARDGAPGSTVVREIRVVGDQVLALRSEGDVYYGSIHFKGVVSEGGAADDEISEVFHFVAQGVNGPWKLEGIEPFKG